MYDTQLAKMSFDEILDLKSCCFFNFTKKENNRGSGETNTRTSATHFHQKKQTKRMGRPTIAKHVAKPAGAALNTRYTTTAAPDRARSKYVKSQHFHPSTDSNFALTWLD